MLINPNNPNYAKQSRNLPEAARAMGIQISTLKASGDNEIEQAFVALERRKPGALFVASDPFFNSRREVLVAQVVRLSIPAMFHQREFVTAGRSDQLRQQRDRHVSQGRRLHRPNTQRRQACRSASAAAGEI